MTVVGDFLENAIGKRIESKYEAPLLEGDPEPLEWYRVMVPDGMSGDGSEYHIYIKKGLGSNLCVFLSGGGVAWNEYTAARPVTGGKVAAGLPNYYWNNLRPFTQIMNINTGITEIGNPKNPFDSWNFIIITYATGDFHVGNSDFAYKGEDGSDQVLHFHGYKNFLSGMRIGSSFFRNPERILIAGDSAGAFAVPAVTPAILEFFYPECTNVTLLSDSGQLLYRKWRTTARDVWKADQAIWEPIHSSNLTVDWYRKLYSVWGDRLKYLYACSTRDYLLSAYYNDVANKKYATDLDVQIKFNNQMRDMLKDLKAITPRFGMFIYDWANLRGINGGTVHTAVRQKRFFFRTQSGLSMAEWLVDAVSGNVYDANMELMSEGKK